MKKDTVFLFCLICAMFFISAQRAFAQEETDLQKGTKKWEQKYHQALCHIQKTKLFDTMSFLYHEREDGIPLHFRKDDRTLLFPLFLSFNTSKRGIGLKLVSKNLFKKEETTSLSVKASRDGAQTQGTLSFGRHFMAVGFTHLSFDQQFYDNGWSSTPGVFIPSADEKKYQSSWLGSVHTRQDKVFLSYHYQLSSHWNVGVSPNYEYDKYETDQLGNGNLMYLGFSVQYTDEMDPSLSMKDLGNLRHARKKAMMANLPRILHGKLVNLSYNAGGKWLGSKENLEKVSLSAAYLLTMKQHHRLAFFAKAERAFTAPFSNKVESDDLLFGLGIYDRQQRGKGGVSGGVSFTYYLLKNEIGLLSLMPFWEQAYVTSGGHSYTPHSGVGAEMEYRLWAIPFPIALNFTQNVNDGSHHIGLRIGGRF